MKREISSDYLINILLDIKENQYSIELMERLCDNYFFEEGDIAFSADYINNYNFLMIFFQENLAKLDDSKFESIIDYLINSLRNNVSREEILIVLYFDSFLDLQLGLNSKKINKKTFENQIKRIIGEDFDLNKVEIALNSLIK